MSKSSYKGVVQTEHPLTDTIPRMTVDDALIAASLFGMSADNGIGTWERWSPERMEHHIGAFKHSPNYKEAIAAIEQYAHEQKLDEHRAGYMRALHDLSSYFMDASIAAQRRPIAVEICKELADDYKSPIYERNDELGGRL